MRFVYGKRYPGVTTHPNNSMQSQGVKVDARQTTPTNPATGGIESEPTRIGVKAANIRIRSSHPCVVAAAKLDARIAVVGSFCIFS